MQRLDFKAWDINGCLALVVFLETGVLPATAFHEFTCAAVKLGVNFIFFIMHFCADSVSRLTLVSIAEA